MTGSVKHPLVKAFPTRPPLFSAPEDAQTTAGTSPEAAETKSTGAGQVREGKGEMLNRGAGGLPGGGKGSQRPRGHRSLSPPIPQQCVLCPPVWGPGCIGLQLLESPRA